MLKIITSGFYTTIQDQGRFGSRAYGVPLSGVMDSASGQLANALIGNSANTAVLEMTMTGPTLKFGKSTAIAITGADMSPCINELPIKMNTAILINANDILSFKNLKFGFRSYLAIKGGLLSDCVLGSRSMCQNITSKRKLNRNDEISYASSSLENFHFNSHIKFNNSFEEFRLVVTRGPEFKMLSESYQNQISNSVFRITKFHNRMAYQLEPLIKNSLNPILTSPVLPGTVQLTPSGQLIVLMRDSQTTGGYPRVLQLTESAISTLSQKSTGQNVRFCIND